MLVRALSGIRNRSTRIRCQCARQENKTFFPCFKASGHTSFSIPESPHLIPSNSNTMKARPMRLLPFLAGWACMLMAAGATYGDIAYHNVFIKFNGSLWAMEHNN